MPSELTHPVFLLQIAMSGVGLFLFWKHVISRPRSEATGPALPAWRPPGVEILLLVVLVLTGGFIFAAVAGAAVKGLTLSRDASTVVATAGAQFGMLAGVLTFAARSPGYRLQGQATPLSILRSGVGTFLVLLPFVFATTLGWELLLRSFGIEPERQDLVRMFREAESPLFLAALIFLATVVAPLTEELFFRAGLFRFLRSRTPRVVALLAPAIVFALLHINWDTRAGIASLLPLVLLAVVFSMAYERTGHIGTVIIAHGLFNLNTIISLLSGIAE